VKPKDTLRVLDLRASSASVMVNYAESLIALDRDNNWVPCLAESWKWIDDRTIEFKLREGVKFHNGESFDAEVVRVNWEAYRRMETPRPFRFLVPADETLLEIIDDCTVRFSFPEPDGLAFVKLRWFLQFAPAFFAQHKFDEKNWGFLPEVGPWGTGPFELVEGNLRLGRSTDRIVLEAYEGYWDPRYPKIKKVIFDNTLIGNRKEAMRVCRESEGALDIVSFTRPLDTLKVAESPYAKVVKSRDVNRFGGFFNQRKKESKWRDVRLRRALNYAVNREELRKYASKGNAYNLGGFIPPEAYGYNPNLDLYGYDTEKARALLAEAGFQNGFQMKIITTEAWRLEAQIISKMLERIGLKLIVEVLTFPEYLKKVYVPVLEKPPEEQDWDLGLDYIADWYGHTGASFLTFFLLDESEFRWIEYDPHYEKMWRDMARTVNPEMQEDRIRQIAEYICEQAHLLFIFSPISLYAINKEVNFVPQKFALLRLKESSVTEDHWSARGKNN
jgi:peptide/nickel transport system substrate-binding protein